MSLRNKFFSIFALVAGIAIFSIGGFAQDTKTSATTPTDKTDRPARGEGREFGGRKHGGEGMAGHGHRGGPGGMMHGLRGIDLTDAQKTQIHSIMEANRPDKANFETMRPLMQAKRNGTITADQQAQLKAFKEESRAKAKSVHEQIMAVLTPEQKQQIETRKQEMKQHMEQRRQEWQQRKQKPATTTDKPGN